MNRARSIKNFIKNRLLPKRDQFKSIRDLPRFTPCEIYLFARKLKLPDNASFFFMYKELFKVEIYKFHTNIEQPYIIDAGANIGLASIYFKRLFPDAKIIAFEPDPYILKYLRYNLDTFNYDDIEIVPKGLHGSETTLPFVSERSDAGFFDSDQDETTTTSVLHVTKLSNYLTKRVDFLKLDIEGAETTVIQEISSNLNLVERIFVEYHSYVDKPQSLDTIISILNNAGFRLHINAPGLSSIQPFINLNTYNNMDMQLNIYGFKESR